MQELIRNKRYCTWPVLVGIVKKNLFKKKKKATQKTQQFFFYSSIRLPLWLFLTGGYLDWMLNTNRHGIVSEF